MRPVDDAPAERDEVVVVDPEPPEPVRAGADGEDVPAASSAGADGAPPPPARRVPPLLWVALVVLLVIAVAASALAAGATAERNRDRRDRQQVEEVAGRLATALSTYDYRDFEATKRRVLALSTGAFASEYERAVVALASLIDQTKATSEATANDVFVGNLGSTKASAIVVLEIRASGVGGPRVSVDNYVDLSLVKVEGHWRVDGVRNLNLGVAGGGTSTPPTTGSTAPAPTVKPSP